jgi:hypothetical protein
MSEPNLTKQIDRVRDAEDRFVQDLIDAEYQDEVQDGIDVEVRDTDRPS